MTTLQSVTTLSGRYDQAQGHYTLVVGRFNSLVVDSLVQGAVGSLQRHGILDKDIRIVYVPGAFEIPLAVQTVAAQKQDDAIIALGAVIRGGTPHFEYISSEATSGISTVALDSGIPVANGVLTVNSIEQAIERSGTKAGNKGEEAAMCALEMVSLLRQL